MTITGKMVLDADHGKIDKAAKKTQAEYKKIGKTTQSVGNDLDKWGKQAANTLVGISAILQTVRAFGQEIKRQRQEAANASRTKGQALLERGKSVRALGLDDALGGSERAMTSVQSTGGVDQSVIDSFIAGLSKMKGKEKPKAQSILRGVGLLQSGLFSEGEVTEAIKAPGGLDKLAKDMGRRQSSLTFSEQKEMERQRFERESATIAENQIAARGGDPRAMEAIQKRQDAMNPLTAGFYNTVGKVPLVGEFTEMGRDLGTGGQAARKERQIMIDTQRAIERNTRPTPRPNFSTDAGGSQ